MITLKRNEDIEIFQVELALKSKTKQSPFISILILAQEQEEISAETLQQNLLTSLPVRACENLLKRLEQQGYLQKEQSNMFGYRQTYQDSFANYLLTDFGQESATDKSFWIGEKGVYNVYTSSNLFDNQFSSYHILKIEKSKDLIDDRNRDSEKIKTPQFITAYQDISLTLIREEIRIEAIEKLCFKLQSISCNLEIQAKENETVLKLSNNNQPLFQTDIQIEEDILQKELLVSCGEFEYDEDKKAILTEFSKDNLSFHRKVKIGKPIFQRNQFNQVELENISHIPSDKQNADRWYWELLYKNMNDYFLDENSFTEFASKLASPIQLHFKVKVPKRKELAEILNEREDAFYQIAKLETTDYLNY
jgi:phage FluMu protein Com